MRKTILNLYFGKIWFYILVINLFSGITNAQVVLQSKAHIENVDFRLDSNVVIITYDIQGAKSREVFDVTPTIYDATTNAPIHARTFSGDLSGVKQGNGKKIIWHIAEDTTYLDRNIYVQLEAKLTNPKIIPYTSKGKAFLYSTAIPGWGTSKITLHYEHLIKGLAAYSAIGLSIKYNLDARKDYQNYQDATEVQTRNNYYNKAENDLRTSRVLLAGALSMWVIDYTWMAITRNKTEYKSNFDNSGISLNTINGTAYAMITLNYKF